MRTAFALAFTAVLVATPVALAMTMSVSACDLQADADAGGPCGGATCTDKQVCLYRECNESEKCRVSTQCAPGETPGSCPGGPGCLVTSCAPKVQGCRDIPATCSGDVICACQNLCGSPTSCKQTDAERNALCVAM